MVRPSVCIQLVSTVEIMLIQTEPKSKRTPVRLRHKIEKAGAAKQRKQRKLAKKVCQDSAVSEKSCAAYQICGYVRIPNGGPA